MAAINSADSARHDFWKKVSSDGASKTEITRAHQSAGDSSISTDKVITALKDLTSEEPKDAAKSKEYLDKALKNAPARVLKDDYVQSLLSTYIISQAEGSEQEKAEAKRILTDTSSKFAAVLDEQIGRQRNNQDFLENLVRYLGEEDSTAKMNLAAEQLLPSLRVKNHKGLTDIDAEGPIMTQLASLSHMPLVQALVKASQNLGLKDTVENLRAQIASPDREARFNQQVSPQLAEKIVADRLGHIFVNRGGGVRELNLGEFGTLKDVKVSNKYKREDLGIDSSKKDPFVKAGIDGFNPFKVFVDILAAKPADKARVIHKNLAYLHVAEIEELEKAKKYDEARDGRPSQTVGSQKVTRETFVRMRYERIRELVIEGGNLISDNIGASLKDLNGLDKDVVDMLTTGNVDKRKYRGMLNALGDIANNQAKLRDSLKGLVRPGDDSDSYKLEFINLNNFEADGYKEISRVDEADQGSGDTLKDARDNYREAFDTIADAISEQVHKNIDQSQPVSQSELDSAAKGIKDAFKDLDKDSFTSVVYDGTQNRQGAFTKLISELANKRELIRFENNEDGKGALEDEITAFVEKIAGEDPGKNKNVKNAIKYLATAIVSGGEVESRVNSLFKLLTEHTFTDKGKQEANNDPASSQQEIARKVHNEGSSFLRRLLRDKPEASDLTRNLSAESIKIIAEEDSETGRNLQRVLKRLTGEANVAEAIKYAKLSKNPGINLLFNQNPLNNEFDPNAALAGFILFTNELDKDSKLDLIKRLMINEDKYSNISDERDRKDAIEDAAEKILETLEQAYASDIQVSSRDAVKNPELEMAIRLFREGSLNNLSKERIKNREGYAQSMNANLAELGSLIPGTISTDSNLAGLEADLQELRNIGIGSPEVTLSDGNSGSTHAKVSSVRYGTGIVIPGGAIPSRVGRVLKQLSDKEGAGIDLSNDEVKLQEALKKIKQQVDKGTDLEPSDVAGSAYITKIRSDIENTLTNIESSADDYGLTANEKSLLQTTIQALGQAQSPSDISNVLNDRNVLAILTKVRPKVSASTDGVSLGFSAWADKLVSIMDRRNELEMAYNDAQLARLDAVQEYVGKYVDFVTTDAETSNTKDILDRTESFIKSIKDDSEVLQALNPKEKIVTKAEGQVRNVIESLLNGMKSHLPSNEFESTKGPETVKHLLNALQKLVEGIKNSIRVVSGGVKPSSSSPKSKPASSPATTSEEKQELGESTKTPVTA